MLVWSASRGSAGKSDSVLIEVCRAEERCLVTLDLDFSHILNLPSSRYAGIAVLRLPEPVSAKTCKKPPGRCLKL